MRQLPGDKYNVAWFKLAEFVARGEKERALGLYRLLIHSFDDVALAHQLEGDLLLSFDDNEAVEKYCQAADLYQKNERLIEAAAVYEHVTTIKPEQEKYRVTLIALYEKLANADRALDHIAQVATLRVKNKRYNELTIQLKEWESKYGQSALLPVYQQIILTAGANKDASHELIRSLMEKVVVGLTDQELQPFLSKLQAVNADLHLMATDLLSK